MKKLLIRLTIIPFAIVASIGIIFYSLNWMITGKDISLEFLDKWFDWVNSDSE
jgi:hypothetical protein